MMTAQYPFILNLLSYFLILPKCIGILSCPSDAGDGFCPNNSKCCPILSSNGQGHITSGCLPHNKHLEGPGTCCHDHDNRVVGEEIVLGTACQGNYQCGYSMEHGTGRNTTMCLLSDSTGNVIEQMPRYNMAEAPVSSIGEYYGFPITMTSTENVHEHVLAYYSNMGPILTKSNAADSKINTVVIVVHGSGRNADEYLYSMMTAAKMQSCSSDQVLVIAPRFLAVEDGVFSVPVITDDDGDGDGDGGDAIKMKSPMKWNETDPIPHTWRYGANALPPSAQLSSYDAMDAIIEHLFKKAEQDGRFENVKRIVVAGHSAGGQFTHRWSLTSNGAFWGDGGSGRDSGSANEKEVKKTRMAGRRSTGIDIVVAVANPRSFAYLDSRRFTNSNSSNPLFEIPSQELRESCPTYNSWEWGLDEGGLSAPYKDKALALFQGDTLKLATRYSQRRVVYLAGGNDTEHLRGSCEDDWFQGPSRVERSRRFFESMERVVGKSQSRHDRYVVDNVGHDHGLIFQSIQARTIIFGSICKPPYIDIDEKVSLYTKK